MADITAIILTKNEEMNISDCINSIKGIVKRIIVIDSFSDDRTIEIARELGAEIIQHEFINHAKQYKYCIETSNIKTKWIFRIDADERLTEESAKELDKICRENMESNVNGIVVRFKKNFLGKDLYHGGVYPWKKLIVYKNGKGYMEERSMDEHIVVPSGKIIELKNDSLHLDFKNIESWINKHNWYSSKETMDYYSEKTHQSHNSLKTLIKVKIYYKIPMGLRSYMYYFYRYYLRFGFLDGKEGKIYAFMQAYWYRFLVDTKIYECKKMNIRYKVDGDLK